jgi:SpoVK/Ycf46/Vps4 family AAA+-type ATPase
MIFCQLSNKSGLKTYIFTICRTNVELIAAQAAQLAPSVIIMDEVDAIAGSRSQPDAPYLREIVSQLLVLMDGLSERGRVLLIATTNCPDHIDSAILRPGRIDRQIFMGPPDKTGRVALFKKLLSRMPVAKDISADRVAALTEGLSGAQIEHLTNEADPAGR